MGQNHASNTSHAVVYTVDVVTTSGSTSASTGDLKGGTIVGLITPASLSSTSLTFSVAADSSVGTFSPLTDITNSSYSVTVDTTANQYFFDPAIFAGVRAAKVESSASETSKTFTFIVRSIT